MDEVLLGVAIVLGGVALYFGLREASVRIGTRSLYRDYPDIDRRALRRRFRCAFDHGAQSIEWMGPRRRG